MDRAVRKHEIKEKIKKLKKHERKETRQPTFLQKIRGQSLKNAFSIKSFLVTFMKKIFLEKLFECHVIINFEFMDTETLNKAMPSPFKTITHIGSLTRS